MAEQGADSYTYTYMLAVGTFPTLRGWIGQRPIGGRASTHSDAPAKEHSMVGHKQVRLLGPILAILFVSTVFAQQNQRSGGQRGSRREAADQVKEGQVAPDFRLETVDGKRTVRLSSFKKKKPVALIFGSYT